ncbi:hypothetical protein K445DRAFT_72703 [Daldinia sp. EC12]|nr:aminotransferase, class III [Daldinia eschscholtzii]OTB19127.1 hypothetical protein K445DRAFT_72703 [Daldinia sp. EC12]
MTTTQESRALVVKGEGSHIFLDDNRKLLDASGGAGVVCIGYGHEKVTNAVCAQVEHVPYVPSRFFNNSPATKLTQWIKQRSKGHFVEAYYYCSGSEAMEAAIKVAYSYHIWKGEPNRKYYITRKESYHGTTIGSLAISGHLGRRSPFESILPPNVYGISACNSYRHRKQGETDAEFVSRKVDELEQAFIKLGPHTVAAFIAEPVVGAASGCLPAVPGYFKAVKEICEKHGALFIFDEVMCGMGRTGTHHAWEQEDATPDIQAIGKGLASGYQPISAILLTSKIISMKESKGAIINHGHTFQDNPVGCAAALAVQEIIENERLLPNVKEQGYRLGMLLKKNLGSHPQVGNIRGRGLFWAVEFVRDKITKEPFDPELQVAYRIRQTAMNPPHNMIVYDGQGCAGNGMGDHVMIMPAYNTTEETINSIVGILTNVIHEYFKGLKLPMKLHPKS